MTGLKDLATGEAATATYWCYRDGSRSNAPVSETDALEFLDACGFGEDSLGREAALSGAPFEADGGVMRFERISGGAVSDGETEGGGDNNGR